MRSLGGRILAVVWSLILAFPIVTFGQGVWGVLVVTNLKSNPAIPWAVPVMAFLIWLMWQYLGGRWWPPSTSEARRRHLRANRVSGQAMGWALLAGVLSITALAGYWIVMFQLVKMPGNLLPNVSQYPLLTVSLMVVMGSLAAPFSEEAAFRGYCQVILEREFRSTTAVVISSVFFALAHGNQGWVWPKLLGYFLAGVMLGAIAYLTNSILPGIAVHIVGDMSFFTLVWPHDSARRLLGEAGADRWFWIHLAQAVLFTALALAAFIRLARVTARTHAAGSDHLFTDSARARAS